MTTAYLELLAHQFEDAGAPEQLETVVTLLARRLGRVHTTWSTRMVGRKTRGFRKPRLSRTFYGVTELHPLKSPLSKPSEKRRHITLP